jgi:hypothetical protein
MVDMVRTECNFSGSGSDHMLMHLLWISGGGPISCPLGPFYTGVILRSLPGLRPQKVCAVQAPPPPPSPVESEERVRQHQNSM